MKKVLFALTTLLFVAPVMAVPNVDISCEYVGDHWFAIKYDVTGGPPKARAFALNISTNLSVIDDIRGFHQGQSSQAGGRRYGIFPGSINWPSPPPAPPVWGDPVADPLDPGTVGVLGDPAITVELGSLYDVSIPGDAPLNVGTLCEIHVQHSGVPRVPAYDAIVLTIQEETASRGGIVMEDLSTPTVSVCGTPIAPAGTPCAQPVSWTTYPCFMCGDSNNDGVVNYDIDINALIAAYPFPGAGTYNPNADFNKDGIINYDGDVFPVGQAWVRGAGNRCTGGCPPP